MEDPRCPNYDTCRLVHTANVVSDSQRKEFYLRTYCTTGNKAWGVCKRYIAKNILEFCADFVLPDSPLSPSEIVDEFDKRSDDGH